MRRTLIPIVTVVLAWPGPPPALEAQGARPPRSSLPDPSATRIASITSITRENAADLRPLWTFSTGSRGAHGGQPVVADSLLVLQTPWPGTVYALDLNRPGGTIGWQWKMPIPRTRPAIACCEGAGPGPAIHPAGLVIVPLLPGQVAALDLRTGQERWRVAVGDGAAGRTINGTPLVADSLVLVGLGSPEFAVRGALVALDARTGALRWRAESTGPDAEVLLSVPGHPVYPSHQGRELGLTTWPGMTWRTGGGAVSGPLSWDPVTDLIYHGTAAPIPWRSSRRAGDAKWTSSIIARDRRTGRTRWALQTTPNDTLGFGAATENILLDFPVGGTPSRALVHLDPNGFAYTLDRVTGRVLLVERYGPVNWASHVDRATARPVPAAPPAGQPVCPAPIGIRTGGPGAAVPGTSLIIVPLANLCMTTRPDSTRVPPGAPATGTIVSLVPGPGNNLGRIIAWDAARAIVTWEIREPWPVLGGVLVTRTGLAMYGTLDGWFRVVDLETGRELYSHQLPSGVIGNPIAFRTPDGHDRIAIVAGVGGWMGAPFRTGGPDLYGTRTLPRSPASVTTRGGVLTVFGLPDDG